MTNEKEKREPTIVIVLSEAEKKQIQDFAAVDHMKVSPWCRMHIHRAIDQIKYEQEARVASLRKLDKS